MTKLKILVPLNFILVLFNFIFILKNFFINYKGSAKSYKNIIFIVLLVISIIWSATYVLEGKRGIDIISALNNPEGFNLTKEEEKTYQRDLDRISAKIPKSTIICYILSAVAYLQYANIQSERKKNLKKTQGWNFSKIKKD